MSQAIEKIDAGSLEVGPKFCKHNWEPCLTPPDSSLRWYRCSECGAFGHPKRHRYWGGSTAAGSIVPYRCSVAKCKGIAIDRKYGRGYRCSYLWRCRDHVDTDQR